MKKKSRKSLAPFSVGIFVVLLSVTALYYLNYKSGNVLGKSYPPSEADIKAKTGGTVTTEGVSLIVNEGTFDDDVYFRVDRTSRSNPISVDGLWQVTDLWEARVKYMSNNDQVNEFAASKSYILAFPYTTQYLTTDQGLAIPQDSLKIIRGETATGPWTVLTDSVVDQANKTVSIITNRGGFFMIAGGFYKPTGDSTSSNQTKNAVSAIATHQENTIVLKQNEVVVTITPAQDIGQPLKEEITPISSNISKTIKENDQIKKPNLFTALYSIISSIFNK